MKLRTIVIIAGIIAWGNPCFAQSVNAANTWSNVTVYSAIGIDTIDSLRSKDKKHALGCQALRLGINNGINQLVKNTVTKARPDGSDNKSFYSGHTSNAFVSSGWNYSIGIPLGITTGALRIKAKKHDWIDVSVGALAGLLTQRVCSKD